MDQLRGLSRRHHVERVDPRLSRCTAAGTALRPLTEWYPGPGVDRHEHSSVAPWAWPSRLATTNHQIVVRIHDEPNEPMIDEAHQPMIRRSPVVVDRQAPEQDLWCVAAWSAARDGEGMRRGDSRLLSDAWIEAHRA